LHRAELVAQLTEPLMVGVWPDVTAALSGFVAQAAGLQPEWSCCTN
jgi:hypothetical protein